MGLGDFAGDIASAAKGAAKVAAKHITMDAQAFASGANQIIGAPTVGTVKGALSGNRSDIAKTALGLAAVVPVAGVASRIGRGAEEAGTIRNLVNDATLARSYRGTAEELAPHMQLAGKMQRLSQAPVSASMRTRSIIANGERGALDMGKISQFPDTTANIVRRAKARVFSAIGGGEASQLASKIAQTKAEIVKLGGTPPTGPFAGATAAKVSQVTGELGSMMSDEQLHTMKAGFEGSRISDKAKRIGLSIMKGGEEGAWKLPGTSELNLGAVKNRAWFSTNERAVSIAKSVEKRSASTKSFLDAYKMSPAPRMHPTRLPKN